MASHGGLLNCGAPGLSLNSHSIILTLHKNRNPIFKLLRRREATAKKAIQTTERPLKGRPPLRLWFSLPISLSFLPQQSHPHRFIIRFLIHHFVRVEHLEVGIIFYATIFLKIHYFDKKTD
ncbi:unnamed protein product, partial [Vitis vinifera]|uniref:Uncharacterized protein n=1 Tax=Vitis vinifera TaxID=29760 RepID=D7SRR4_VITVI